MSLRVGLIGVGVMGRNHARILDALDEVQFVAAADPRADAAAYIQRRTHAKYYPDHESMLAQERLDAVVIAVPTAQHHAVASSAIDLGLSTLVEKPLAASSVEADDLIRRARRRGVLLTVGHVERFNPAVTALRSRIERGDLGRVFEIQTRRQSPLPPRVADVGVAVDLATHDIDLIRYISGREPESLFARTARRLHATREDLLAAILSFPEGLIATIEVNWLTPTKIRELSVIGERGMFRVHHLRQELTFYSNSAADDDRSEGWSTLAQLVGVEEGDVTRLAIGHAEPLLLELRDFVAACVGRGRAAVSAEDGAQALRLAEALLRSAELGEAVPLVATG